MAMDFAVRRTMLRSITLSARASLRKLDELSKFPSDISPLSYSLTPPLPLSLSLTVHRIFRTFSFLRPGQVPLFGLHNYLHMTRQTSVCFGLDACRCGRGRECIPPSINTARKHAPHG